MNFAFHEAPALTLVELRHVAPGESFAAIRDRVQAARTIAASDSIQPPHLLEAIQYRSLHREMTG